MKLSFKTIICLLSGVFLLVATPIAQAESKKTYSIPFTPGNGSGYSGILTLTFWWENGKLVKMNYAASVDDLTVASGSISLSNPNPEDSGSGSTGDSADLASGIIAAIEQGKIVVIAGREDFSNSGLYDYLSENGFVGGFDPVGNPSEDGLGTIGISGGVGGEELEKTIDLIENIMGGMPGADGSVFIDEAGEFIDPSFGTGTPGGGTTGGGSGDNTGDGSTNREAEENGYYDGFYGTDGLVINPKVNTL